MDLSKLPKLSNTPQPPPEGPMPPAQHIQAAPLPGAEAVFSLIIGIIVLLMQQRCLQQLSHWLFGTAVPLGALDEVGRPLAYAESVFFIHDSGLAIFAAALILEGLTLFIRRTPVLIPSFLLMIQAVLWNLYTVVFFYRSHGLQYMPAVALAFAIYIGMLQWGMLLAWWRRENTLAS